MRDDTCWPVAPWRFGGLFGVSDGVTTAGRGEMASRLTCERLSQFVDDAASGDEPKIKHLVQLVAEIDWELRGAGASARCTLSLLWMVDYRAHVVCVGDSPVFRLRSRRVERLSLDPRTEGRRLSSYLGVGADLSEVVHLKSVPVRVGDVFLLMTDGASGSLDSADLLEAWNATRDADQCARRIVDHVASVGVDDDATVVVVEVEPDPGAPPSVPPVEAPDPPDHLKE